MADYERRNGMSPLAAGLLGAVVGAIGSAAVIIFSKEENRTKAKKKFSELKDKGTQVFHDLERKAKDMASKTEKEIEEEKQAVEQKLSRRKRK